MLHQPASAYYRARTPEFLLEVEELHKVREMITRVYALRTGKPFGLGGQTRWTTEFSTSRLSIHLNVSSLY